MSHRDSNSQQPLSIFLGTNLNMMYPSTCTVPALTGNKSLFWLRSSCRAYGITTVMPKNVEIRQSAQFTLQYLHDNCTIFSDQDGAVSLPCYIVIDARFLQVSTQEFRRFVWFSQSWSHFNSQQPHLAYSTRLKVGRRLVSETFSLHHLDRSVFFLFWSRLWSMWEAGNQLTKKSLQFNATNYPTSQWTVHMTLSASCCI